MTTRRRFLSILSTATIGTSLLSGTILSSLPALAGPSKAPVKATGKLETTSISLGFIPILESAPLVIAQEKGFFAKHGLTAVQLTKQASWPSARDNVVLGSGSGGIDGGQWQLPMPQMLSVGAITNGKKCRWPFWPCSPARGMALLPPKALRRLTLA
jgi:bicarbonate transport system substrate-binding protein